MFYSHVYCKILYDFLWINNDFFFLGSCRELVLASNKKNVDEHVILLKWSLKDDKTEVLSLEFQSDKYTPRIELQGK